MDTSTLDYLLAGTTGVVGVVVGTTEGEVTAVDGAVVDGDAMAAAAASLTGELGKIGGLLGLGELRVASLKAATAGRVFTRQIDSVVAIELDAKRPLGDLETKLRSMVWAAEDEFDVPNRPSTGAEAPDPSLRSLSLPLPPPPSSPSDWTPEPTPDPFGPGPERFGGPAPSMYGIPDRAEPLPGISQRMPAIPGGMPGFADRSIPGLPDRGGIPGLPDRPERFSERIPSVPVPDRIPGMQERAGIPGLPPERTHRPTPPPPGPRSSSSSARIPALPAARPPTPPPVPFRHTPPPVPAMSRAATPLPVAPSRPSPPPSIPAPVAPTPSGPVFTGDLEEFALPDLLEFLRNSHRTGILSCTTAAGSGIVRLSRGMITGADSPNALDLREHFLTNPELNLDRRRALAALPPESFNDDQIDEMLGARALVSREEIEAARTARVYSAFREMIGWTSGRFSFDPSAPVATAPALALSAQTILMQIYQEQDEQDR